MIDGRRGVFPRDSGGAAVVSAKNYPAERRDTGMEGKWVWRNVVASVSGISGDLAPLSHYTHNMKGRPLNVMEVVRSSRSQYEWRVSST